VALLKKNGVIVASAPSIAGYMGAYTGIKDNKFTISYNVRQIFEKDGIDYNLDYEINKDYT
jgi:hypothetical protein